jgi:hypothetical protein
LGLLPGLAAIDGHLDTPHGTGSAKGHSVDLGDPARKAPCSGKGPLIEDLTPISHTEGWLGLPLVPGGAMR